MTTQNLLVELLVEELPPKALNKLGEAFASVLAEQLRAQGLASAGSVLTAFASPRRLGAHLTQVADRAADRLVQQKLMPVSVGLDAQGRATPALLKKLTALGADLSDPLAAVARLKRAPDGKSQTLFYDSTMAGVTLAQGLQVALDAAITGLPIPKVMSYQLQTDCEMPGWSSVQFVRPAHKLIALHADRTVDVAVLGLRSGRETLGHRFEAAVSPLLIADADSYAATLARDGAVIASFAERRAEIARQLGVAAARLGGGVRAIEDDALLDEVTALVERPNVLVCSFGEEFLQVPQECLILTMKANQKYFPLLDAQGRLTHRFLVVSNITPEDPSAVIGGNERVVRPRLADAKFFFDQDRKKTLDSRVVGLDKVVYHNKLGTQGQRSQRVRAIARAIALELGDKNLVEQVDTAARLAKTDLLTDMVGEFPELQGIMGGYYARHDGLPEDLAQAIEDHYKPRFAGDELPRNTVGIVVALADKLETLAGMFGIGNLPTGDKDPFALRRHALGVIRMRIERQLPMTSSELVDAAFDAFPEGLIGQARTEVNMFLQDRLHGYLRDSGYSSAEVDAVVAATASASWADLPGRLAAVRAFAALPEAAALAAANKRIGNILKKAPDAEARVSEALLHESAEKALFVAMQEVLPQADARFADGDFTASLQALAALRVPVDAFFDKVMVNAEAPELRRNRLGLLKTLHDAMNRVADLSRLVT